MTIKAHFDGKVLVPDEPVDLPVGQRVELEVIAESDRPKKGPLQRLAELAKRYPDNDPNAPTDGAAQHDHYLYGTSKKP